MKKSAKSFLHRAGLLGPVQRVYFNLKTASPSVVYREVFGSRSPKGIPTPPPDLIYDIIACNWRAVYLDSGRHIAEDLFQILEDNDITLEALTSILDFGCGCGRLIRHFAHRTEARLTGSDYNPRLVRWCSEHLPFGQFTTNGPLPPLSFDEQSFDLIYARSIFTHFTREIQELWMTEMHRVLKPGGYFYFTMHGEPLARGLSPEQRSLFDAGQLVVTYSSLAGENLCSSYGSRTYVEHVLLDRFTLVDFIEGRDAEHLRQDIYLLQRTD